MVKYTLHLLGRTPSPDIRRHFVHTFIEVVGQVEHLDPSEMHEEYNMVGISPRVSPLIGEVLHDNFHQGLKYLFKV